MKRMTIGQASFTTGDDIAGALLDLLADASRRHETVRTTVPTMRADGASSSIEILLTTSGVITVEAPAEGFVSQVELVDPSAVQNYVLQRDAMRDQSTHIGRAVIDDPVDLLDYDDYDIV